MLRRRSVLKLLTIGCVVLASALSSPGVRSQGAPDEREHAYGQRTFEDRCAVCHGIQGRGDGPMASILNPRPADLGLLSERNGGKFPFGHIYKVIDGRYPSSVKGHGTRAMPIWGDEFNVEVLEADLPGVYAEEIVQGRILGLVYYLETLQVK